MVKKTITSLNLSFSFSLLIVGKTRNIDLENKTMRQEKIQDIIAQVMEAEKQNLFRYACYLLGNTDEAEDLSIKLIKCLGTRVGKGSELILLGDLKQAENQYKVNNGIATFIEHSLDSPLVGVVWLPEDVRSEMSKLFAEL